MPFASTNPIVRVEPDSMRTIDTSNVENLFGLWSVFSKCAGTMEDGKRLENMSWRLWNRETFCCAPDLSRPRRIPLPRQDTADSFGLPELSSSVDSQSSVNDQLATCPTRCARPELDRVTTSKGRSCRREKHITPGDLQELVISIKEQQDLEPLAPLPLSLQPDTRPQSRREDITPRPSSPPLHTIPESSSSTVATVCDSELDNMSPPVGSDVSTSTDLSSHSVVRGFSLGCASSSLRSKTQLAPPPSILKNSPQKVELRRMESKAALAEQSKKKGAMFQLGTSSDEDATSSVETSHMNHSSFAEGFRRPAPTRKRASFKIGADIATTQSEEDEEEEEEEEEEEDNDEIDSDAIDTDDDPSESAIDDDDDDWLDEEDESGPSSVNPSELFQRVDSRPNLTSRRSLITSALHEGDRVRALQNDASRSSPAIRRSRTSSPNGPSIAASPKENTTPHHPLEQRGMLIPSKPIIMTTSNTHPPALSPRTTRRNMLSTELTESLRKHLLWERQQKNATSNAALKRRHTSTDMKNLKQYPGQGEVKVTPLAPIRENAKTTNSWNAYFDHGLQEYHIKGW
ncbi:DUF1752-domain-containing protein [Pseudovirgaria hyperparasitica]|uniref:DUF1752-domain-containing protein n=1 Tax=Pseudovirgaria hyperparasitica TaxID=470096 RepID=A0A6A6WBW4_9PEZI|nr:DUF1752-domain-containing protein [Pseudovirgaria hyperparasitica]KAF2760322.1 DUF1752-domain-containing protein [Pseudovirgaria hyperparasitica]